MVCAVGEGYDSSNATAVMPTLTRHNGETIITNSIRSFTGVRYTQPRTERPKRLRKALYVNYNTEPFT